MFKNKILIISAIVLAVFLVFFGFCFAKACADGKIQTGVRAGNISLSGLTSEEAINKLSEECNDSAFEKTYTIVFDDVKKEVCPLDFLAEYDYKATVQKAQVACKGKNKFESAFKIMSAILFRKNIPMELVYDKEEFDTIMDDLMSGIDNLVTEHNFEIDGNKLIVTTGSPGEMPDRKTVVNDILDAIRFNKKSEIVYKKESRSPGKINVDHLYEQVYAEAADASYSIEGSELILTPHIVGISFDKDEAEKIIQDNEGYNKTFSIPLVVQMPQVLTEDIEAKLFSETIGEYTTKYNAGDISRSKNIALASKKINGTILAPGAVFSYNDTVGERSYSEGFETAHVYVNGEVVDGIGGGICQVSSTLYNAVLYANLEIVSRTNHQLTVSYVPLGRDATVDYGNIDFKFKNSLNYPIKIVSEANNGTMYIAVHGYKEDKSLNVTLESETIGTKPPREKRVDDPTLPKGEEKVVSEGTMGFIVDAYKTVTCDGKDPVRTYLGRSNYEGSMRVINVGTGEPKEEIPSDEILDIPVPHPFVETPTEVPAETPVKTPSIVPTESPENNSAEPSFEPLPEEEVSAPTEEMLDIDGI